MLHTSIKKFRVILEYGSHSASIDVEPYRQIKYLKERASKLFYPLKFEVKLTYSNKDLTPYDTVTLGEYFKNKSNITIKVTQILNFNEKVKNDVLSNNNLVKGDSQENFLCSCKKYPIKHYCRHCNELICEACRLNNLHRYHQAIHVDISNFDESIKLYAISLQADISMNLKASRKYNKEFQFNKFIDFQSRKEIIIRKLDELERKQVELLKGLTKQDQNNFEGLMNDFEEKGNNTYNEIEHLIEDIFTQNKKLKKINIETAMGYFDMINKKEKDIEKLTNKLGAYRMEYDINKKFDNMYNIIEKAIDNVLKNEFNFNHIESVNDTSLLNIEVIKELKENVGKTEIKLDNQNSNKIEKKDIKFNRIVIEAVDKENIENEEVKNHTIISKKEEHKIVNEEKKGLD